MAYPRLTGAVEIIVNAQPVLNKEGATASGVGISGEASFERTPQYGDTGLHGYTEANVGAMCEVTLSDREDQLLDTLARINGDGTIIFRAYRGGKVYTMEEATCLGNFSISNGEVTNVRFHGEKWTETVE
jgi:hypothetical protein